MVWALRGHAVRMQANDGKCGLSSFLFLNEFGEVSHVHGNIVQSNYLVLCKQIKEIIRLLDDDLGANAGFLMLVDNSKQH